MASASKAKRQKLSEPESVVEDAVPFNYKELFIIGTGAYGTVYRARDNQTGRFVAIKKMRIPLSDNGVSATTLREISLLKQLNKFDHANIVKLFEVCQFLEPDGKLLILLVFEYMEQDLSDLIEGLPKSGVSTTTLKRLAQELLTGVDFLHANRIIHRDLKPQNVLVSSQGRVKIADFGLAKSYNSEMRLTSVVVTLWYRAPEVLLGQSYNSTVDIWSTACIIFEMFNRRPLFPGTSEKNQLDRIFELTGRPEEDQWPQTISLSREHFPERLPKRTRDFCSELCDDMDDLLNQMLSYDLHRRPSALACLEHSYFQRDPE